MQGRDYIFCLQDKDFNFWRVDDTGFVSKTANSYFLDFAPDGWYDIAVQNIRNKNYWGVDRSVTIPLKYVIDGADILKTVFYTLGTEEPLYLVVASQQLDYNKVPAGIISGGNILNAGNNQGTITGKPGEKVYLHIKINGGDGSSYFYGQIGDTTTGTSSFNSYSILVPQTDISISIILPASGSVNYNISYFQNDTSTASITAVNSLGTTSGEYGYWYKKIYRGQIDLSTFAHNGSTITCTTLEDGLAKYLKANEGTVFEFPMNVPDALMAKMDGINLHDKLNYQLVDKLAISLNDYTSRWYVPTNYLNNEGDSTGIGTSSETAGPCDPSWDTMMATANFIMENLGKNTVIVTLTGTIEYYLLVDFHLGPPSTYFKMRFLTTDLEPAGFPDEVGWEILKNTAEPNTAQLFRTDFNIQNIPVHVNQKLFLQGMFLNVGYNQTVTFTENCKLSVSFTTRYDTTYIRAFRPQYLFEQLISKVTEDNYTAAISAFFAAHKNKVLTSGNAIRGFDDATIKISFSDFFKWCNSFGSVGLNDNNDGTAVIEDKENLVDTSNIIDLPEVASDSFKVSVSKDYLFNELDIGYDDISSDVGTLNGNEEFNTKFIFSLGTTIAPAVLDKISPVQASCYEIEKIRVTQIDKDTTDFTTDNKNYVLAISDDVQAATDTTPESYLLDRSLNAGATGLIEPETVFNIPLSPHRNFLRNGSFIRSSCFMMDSKIFKFISAVKNNKLVADNLVENEDVPVGSLNSKFFNPVLFDFDVEAPVDLLDLLDMNPLQVFRFPFNGDTYLGILEKVSLAPSSKAAQSYQLLSHASNDLTKLIAYYGQSD